MGTDQMMSTLNELQSLPKASFWSLAYAWLTQPHPHAARKGTALADMSDEEFDVTMPPI